MRAAGRVAPSRHVRTVPALQGDSMRDLPSSQRDEQPSEEGTGTVGSSLDHLIGTWTDTEADAMNAALEDFEEVDGAMWK